MPLIKFYKFLVAGLVLLNLTMLALLIYGRPSNAHMGGPNHNNILNKAVEILQLDAGQKEQFRKFGSTHHRQMNTYDSMQIALLPAYFEKLNEPNIGIDSDEILDQISKIERKKVEFTFQHFEDVKSILTPEQLKHYKNFVEVATTRIYNRRKKSKR